MDFVTILGIISVFIICFAIWFFHPCTSCDCCKKKKDIEKTFEYKCSRQQLSEDNNRCLCGHYYSEHSTFCNKCECDMFISRPKN